ncbi:MAG TPA: tetratricopeptide repeat protein [Vicinamibacterales bacterium]|nr:tetratricopeptide repeat protein [Vicinamibacterales bacterium]
MRRVWVAALVLAAGCASAPIKKADMVELATADAKVHEGCYDCLLAARNTYARIAVGKARPLVIGRLFETELLIAVREKALALPSDETIARARSLVPDLPPGYSADRLFALVDAILPYDIGTPNSELIQLRRPRAAYVRTIDGEIAWLASSPLTPVVSQSLTLAIDCAYPFRTPPAGQPRRPPGWRPQAPPDAPPLIRFGVANCGNPIFADLEKLRADVPSFIDAAVFLLRLGLVTARDDGGRNVKERFTEVYARFSNSPAVTYLGGNYYQIIGDCREGLRYYDETIALKPVHERALLGRTICLTYLKRQQDAIAAATRMIELKTFNVSEAYYWRAWNHHFLKDLPQARRDIESAKAIAASGEIFTLAGIIEHDQDDLAVAEKDLKSARQAAYGNRNCTAAWYLGLVGMKRQQWLESSDWFLGAMTCYEQNVAESETGLAQMQAKTDLDPDFKARQIANFEAALKEDRGQFHAAAFNAANQGARGGDFARAKTLIEVAAKDPALADLVKQLRTFLAGKDSARRP